ncbi:MAG: class I SAM-dependent methyltransferase [Pseudomonadota bacterium]
MDLHAIERTYNRYARIYDFVFGAVFQPGRKAIIDGMNCKAAEHILEVGVGTGLSLPLYPRDVIITGIDISPDMLAQAQQRKAECGLENVVQLSVMDAEKMNFPDSSFDKVVAMYVASVVPHPERLVDEMRRVCKPNGRIIFVNHFHSRNPILRACESLLAPLSKQLGFRPNLALDDFLQDTGLKAINIRRVNIFHFCTMVEARNNKQFYPEIMTSVFAAS